MEAKLVESPSVGTLRRRDQVESSRRLDASAIFGMGSLVDELKNVQSNNTQKTADILDSIQRVTSKKAVLDKEGQLTPDCGVCSCRNFEPNVWKPGMCRICQHDHKAAPSAAAPTLQLGGTRVDLTSPTSSPSVAHTKTAAQVGVPKLGVAKTGPKARPMSRTEKLNRILMQSGLVDSVSVSAARRGLGEATERHFVANIIVSESIDTIDVPKPAELTTRTRHEVLASARGSFPSPRTRMLMASNSMPAIAPAMAPTAQLEAETRKLEEWHRAEEERLIDEEIRLLRVEKRLKKMFPDAELLSNGDDLRSRLRALKKKRKEIRAAGATSPPEETVAPAPAAQAQAQQGLVKPAELAATEAVRSSYRNASRNSSPAKERPVPPSVAAAAAAVATTTTTADPGPSDPSAAPPVFAPPPPPSIIALEAAMKRANRRSLMGPELDDSDESLDSSGESSSKAKRRSVPNLRRRLSGSGSTTKIITAAASSSSSSSRMDPAALQSELANLVGRSLVVKTESFIRSAEQPLNEEIAYGKFDYPEHDIFFYRDNFLKQPDEFAEVERGKKFYRIARYMRIVPEDFHEHVNLFAISSDKDHPEKMIVSIKRTPDEYDNFVGLIRSKLGDQPLTIRADSVKRDKKAAVTGPATTKDITAAFRKQFPLFANFKFFAVESSEFPSSDKKKTTPLQVSALGEKNSFSVVPVRYLPVDLLNLDRTLKVQSYKFGIVYVKNGQEKEKHFFSNGEESTSPEFIEFIEFLGSRIPLKGWRGYRGDLDTRENTTGTHSIFTEYEDLEIMFHVSPMLPPDTRQRLIGNDIAAIIFVEPGVVWNPEAILSQVMHAQLIVQPAETRSGEIGFRIDCATRDGVPSTRPVISPKKVYELDEEFRDIILRKLVNCERAAWHCDKKVRNQTRSLQEHYGATRQGQLDFLIERFTDTAKEY